MMKRLFDFDYSKLLPATPRPLPEHSFFLAVPNSRGQIGQALYHWLRANNPACTIFTSHHAGGWNAFRAKVEYVPGVVIIHETLAWSVRRFPNLSKHLIARNDEYWCISEPVHGLPLYPSISEDLSPPGDLRLTRLFPYRTAILLTPSFLVSEPRRALELFEWFANKWVGSFHYRLVTAHNIHEYLSELADERYQARQELWNAPGDIQVDMEANLSGLSRDDCRCRYTVANLAADMNIARTAQAGPFAHDEDNSSLVYADSSIDPIDEQSLVNWFGWWATLRADQFRKFHVIGSSQAITMHGCRRGELRVRIPKYSHVTLDDPDAVLELLQEMNDQVEASEASDANGNGDGDASNMQVSPLGNKRSEFKQGPPGAFRSNLIAMENPRAFAAFFDSLCVKGGFRLQWILYVFPVCWLDLQMAEHFGDFTCEFSRICDWFKFTLPFGSCYQRKEGDSNKPMRGYNTYLGFFYTIDKEWDPDNPPPKKPLERVERHPWIAIYRPVNPHRKQHDRCELIIWDPAARTRYPNGKPPAEKDLIFMQRQLIQHVRENGDEKNAGTWLDQVWFGGWDWPENCDSQYPIDTTLLFLREMLSDIRNFLPAPEVVMERSQWQRVRLSSGSPSPLPPPTLAPPPNLGYDSPLFVEEDDDGDIPMDLDTPSHHPTSPSCLGEGEGETDDDAADPETRVIFHPPRGTTSSSNDPKRPAPFRSRCVNRLYEEARLAKARAAAARDGAPPPSHMAYRFPPTMEWYAEQKGEGRGYAHVNVDSWERVFNLLKIGGGAGGAGAAAGDGSGKEDGGGSGSGNGNGNGNGNGVRDRRGTESTVGSG
jgi:chromo domain-containing protein 1